MENNRQKIDYSGRTVDLLLLKTVLNVPAVNQRVSLDADGSPMVVTGIEKMVQRFAIAFINAMGSTKFCPGHGTRLVPRVSAGLVYDMATLEADASEANLLAWQQVSKADNMEDDTPDDERLVSSEVVGLEFSRSKSRIKISIKLVSAAGDSYVYIIPVDVGVH